LRTHDHTPARRSSGIAQRTLDPARASACAHLGTLAHGCPDLYPLDLDRTGLSPRQNIFANAIVEFATRRWLTLRWLIEQRLDKPFTQLQPEMCGVLLSGAAQLVFLDSVPAYAAIDESVEWAKQTMRPGAGRLANAVLRRIADLVSDGAVRAPAWSMAQNEIPLSDGTAIVLNSNEMPSDERMRFGIATSCPSALYESMCRSFPEGQARAIAYHNMAPAPTVLNIEHSLSSAQIQDLDPHEHDGFAVYRGNHRDLTNLLSTCDDVWAQDVASAQAVKLASSRYPAPGLVIDLCAGLGTKTRQLAAVFPDAKIIATDTNASRRDTLRSVFQWHERVEVVDPHETHRWLGKADLILLDVPCSNTGVLARRVEARYRATDQTIAALVSVQRQIIINAIPMLAPGGKLVYSTCSIDPRENREQAAWAVTQHQLRIDHEQFTLPGGGPDQPQTRYTDGSYAVILALA
jgi:16S rRNA (cytosine967-C5)-methyltransferase